MSKCALEVPFKIRGHKEPTILKVDAADWAELSRYRWYLIGAGYFARRVTTGKCPCCRKTRVGMEYMHRVILGNPEGLQVDHINGDRTDNRRANLRAVTATHNMHNRRRWKSKREFRGVSKKGNRWIATVNYEGARFLLGSFLTAQEAAEAYDSAARTYFGENAKTNF